MPGQRMNRNCQGAHTPRSPGMWWRHSALYLRSKAPAWLRLKPRCDHLLLHEPVEAGLAGEVFFSVRADFSFRGQAGSFVEFLF